jgi:hypothetical protein
MEIEHTFSGTQTLYGYLWWSPKDNEYYRRVFPEGEFTLELAGARIPRRRVNWSKGRLFASAALKRLFGPGERIRILRLPDGVISVEKVNDAHAGEKTLSNLNEKC